MNWEVIFDEDKIVSTIKDLEEKSSNENFWDDKINAHKVLKDIKNYNSNLAFIKSIKENFDLLEFHLEIINSDKIISDESKDHIFIFSNQLDKFEITSLLNNKDDGKNAILNIHPGAGGKESEDWAFMLFRMYKRWIDRNGYNMKILNYQDGDENGLKDVSIEINGDNVYGNLRSEVGVHRLVRISPFDSNSRRHTSFASIFAYPEVDETIEINIDQSEISWETFRASGAGGQSVNKIESAVRLKHRSSGLIIECQQERSQILNKEKAMKMLKSKLYQIELEKVNKEKDERDSKKLKIDFGSQIRNYVLHPYKMIKDVRTNIERGDVNNVLDGDINDFIKGFLLMSK